MKWLRIAFGWKTSDWIDFAINIKVCVSDDVNIDVAVGIDVDVSDNFSVNVNVDIDVEVDAGVGLDVEGGPCLGWNHL